MKISIDSSTKNNKASEVDYSKKEKIDLWREDDWKKLLKKFISTIIFLSSSPTKKHKNQKKKREKKKIHTCPSKIEDSYFYMLSPEERRYCVKTNFDWKGKAIKCNPLTSNFIILDLLGHFQSKETKKGKGFKLEQSPNTTFSCTC